MFLSLERAEIIKLTGGQAYRKEVFQAIGKSRCSREEARKRKHKSPGSQKGISPK